MDDIDYCATCKHYDCEPHFEPCVSCKTKYDGAPTKDSAKKRTNADRIRAMSDEELAEFICGIFDEYDDDIAGKFINGYYIPCYDQYSIKEWLEQPADE